MYGIFPYKANIKFSNLQGPERLTNCKLLNFNQCFSLWFELWYPPAYILINAGYILIYTCIAIGFLP